MCSSLSATRAGTKATEDVMAGKSTKVVALIAAAGMAAGIALAAAPAAQALPEVEMGNSGMCSAGARWELSLEREFRVLDIDMDIEGARAGESWTFTVTHSGKSKKAVRAVADYEGDVEAQWFLRDRAGIDQITVKATSASGQVCAASGRI